MAVERRYTIWYQQKSGRIVELDVNAKQVRSVETKVKAIDPDFQKALKIEQWGDIPDYKADIE